jgi:hypothetical protein
MGLSQSGSKYDRLPEDCAEGKRTFAGQLLGYSRLRPSRTKFPLVPKIIVRRSDDSL